MDKIEIKARIEALLTEKYFCTNTQLNDKRTSFTVDGKTQKPRLSILAYRNSLIICTSSSLSSSIQALLQGRSRDEIFECPYVFGQTIHYVPGSLPEIPVPPQFEFQFLFGDEINSMYGLKGFDNSLAFDENGSTPTVAAYIARCQGQIAGIAGASTIGIDGMLEAGVDVMSDYRNARLGTYLITALSRELLARDILPFYSASVTNLGSQMVASRCGYIPAWVDTFGTTLDGSSVYNDIVDAMPWPEELQL